MRPSPSLNARGAAIPFTHTKPKARRHTGPRSSECAYCTQYRQELNLRDHARVPAVWKAYT